MSRDGAYEEEMGFLRHLRAEDEERLIAGNAPLEGELAEVAAFTRALRASAASQTAPPASAALITQLAETARASAETTEERPRPRLALVARVAVAAATVPFLFAGLAVAGVHLPGPADDAFESIGVELPNQASDTDDDTDGAAKDGDSAGSATGQENSEGKRGHGKTKDKQGKALGHEKAKKPKKDKGEAPGKSGSAPGQTKDKGGSGGSGGAGGNGNAGANSNAGGNGNGGGNSGGGGSPQGQAKGRSK